MKKKKFVVLSPDGFPIRREKTYKSVEDAIKDMKEWVLNYKNQGYYSSVDYGRIPLNEIKDYCKVVSLPFA